MADETDLRCHWTGCSESFDDAEPLFNHVCEKHVGRAVTGNLCLVCSWGDCRKPTTKRDNITSHIRTHIPLRNFQCDHCEKAFKRGVDLKKHQKTHQTESADAQIQGDLQNSPEGTVTVKSPNSSRPKRTPVKSKKAIEYESVEAERTKGRSTRGSSTRQAAKVDDAIRKVAEQQLAAETASPALPTTSARRGGRRASQKLMAEQTPETPIPAERQIAPGLNTASPRYPAAPQISTVHPMSSITPILPYGSNEQQHHYQPPTPVADTMQMAPVAPMLPSNMDENPRRISGLPSSLLTSAQRPMSEIGDNSKLVVQQIGRDVAELILQTEGEATGMAEKLDQLSRTTQAASNIIDEIVQKYSQFDQDFSDSLPRTLAVNGMERIMKILMTLVDNYASKDDRAWDELRQRLNETKDAILSSFVSIALLLPERKSGSPLATRSVSADVKVDLKSPAEEKPRRRKYTQGLYDEENGRTKRRRSALAVAEEGGN